MRKYPILPLSPTKTRPRKPPKASRGVAAFRESSMEQETTRHMLSMPILGIDRWDAPEERADRRERQIDLLKPSFENIDKLISDPTESRISEFRTNSENIVPDRAILFESLEPSTKIRGAVRRIKQLELMVIEQPPRRLTRRSRPRGGDSDETYPTQPPASDREDAPPSRPEIPSTPRHRVLAMPTLDSLRSLSKLWKQWTDNIQEHGLDSDEISNVLDKAHIRPWSPGDRVPDADTLRGAPDTQASTGGRVRLEAELWFRQDERKRDRAFEQLRAALHDVGGEVVDRTTLREIGYDCAEIDIPHQVFEALCNRTGSALERCDSIRYLRPRRLLHFTSLSWEAGTMGASAKTSTRALMLHSTMTHPGRASTPSRKRAMGPQSHESNAALPIAALMDGDVDDNHPGLAGRTTRAGTNVNADGHPPYARQHGTAMASLLLHGDLDAGQAPVSKPIVVCPVSPDAAQKSDNSEAHEDSLAKFVHTNAKQMNRHNDSSSFSPISGAFLINLSMGGRRFDPNIIGDSRPLTTQIDQSSYDCNVLFIVSAGNCKCELSVSNRGGLLLTSRLNNESCWPQEQAVLGALIRDRARRGITTPAESRNSIAVGSQYLGSVSKSICPKCIKPYCNGNNYPNTYSRLGPGLGNAIKPEILMPTGEHPVTARTDHERVYMKPCGPNASGPAVVTPDEASKDPVSLSGTSSSAALATNLAQKLHELLESDAADVSPTPRWLLPKYRAVTIKALLVHMARWNTDHRARSILPSSVSSWERDAVGPEDLPRLIGYGFPHLDSIFSDTPDKLIRIDCRKLLHPGDFWHYSIPIPACLKTSKSEAQLIVTLAWFTPVDHRFVNDWVRLHAEVWLRSDLSIELERHHFQPPQQFAQNGTVFHEQHLLRTVDTISEQEYLEVDIRRLAKDEFAKQPVRYALAISLQSTEGMELYDRSLGQRFGSIAGTREGD